MKKNASILLACLAVLVATWSFNSNQFNNPNKDKLLIELISYVLDRGHFEPKSINDDLSEQMFFDYIEAIDAQKRFFLASDYKEFEQYKYALDDQIKSLKIDFFKTTHTRFLKRIAEVQQFYEQLLDKPFDFSVDEQLDVDYDNQVFSSNTTERKNKWRKQLKYSTLLAYETKLSEEKIKTEEDSEYVPKTEAEIEIESREATLENLKNVFDYLTNELQEEDWFSVYLNAFVSQFDPHTYYFAPEAKDRFDTSMSGKFEGIGARLQKRNQTIKIVDIISGGPVWRGKQVEVGDQIIKVAQGEAEPVDVTTMRLDDAIKLIKGPKGTEVRLTLKRVDGTIEVVSIIRDVVELEESYAKSIVIEKGGKTFGLINLPKFYIDFKDYGERNAAIDVKKEIEKLKKSDIEGLVIDLRNNGGGSLQTVVDMAGLFIEKGPIVQVKTTRNKNEVLYDRDPAILWDGPLVILVNETSASASEILAAALQDYKRAIILGGSQTFGKGTVQNIVDLNRFVSNSDLGNLGALKITTDKYYRINGGSTQLEGVKSDVVVPDRYSYIDLGEKDQSNPLDWDQIEPTPYTTWDRYLNYEQAIQQSKLRVANNKNMQLIDENARWIRQQQDDNLYPLSLSAYQKEIEDDKSYVERFDQIKNYNNRMSYSSNPDDLLAINDDEGALEKRDRWTTTLSKDIYLEEAVSILQDLQLRYIPKNSLASSNSDTE
jgi:carboxyl-terminal processing protease